MQVTAVPKRRGRARCRAGASGIDFVRCLICGKHVRVISGRHLSTHGLDREAYIQEYRLTPDQLCAKEFRRLHSSRPAYYPHGKRDWIAAIKKIHKRDAQVSSGYIQNKYPHVYNQGLWIFGNWDTGLVAAESDPATVRRRDFEIAQKFSRGYA